ncbi:hypothetical protein GF324_05085, partial [bacterium]|nr:hypothetical protein [bacterium]
MSEGQVITLSERQRSVFRIILEQFILSAKPVGSVQVASMLEQGISSATV